MSDEAVVVEDTGKTEEKMVSKADNLIMTLSAMYNNKPFMVTLNCVHEPKTNMIDVKLESSYPKNEE